MFKVETVIGRNAVKRVFINAFSTIGIAAILAFTVGLYQFDFGSMEESKIRSLPVVVAMSLMIGLSFLFGAARIAGTMEKED